MKRFIIQLSFIWMLPMRRRETKPSITLGYGGLKIFHLPYFDSSCFVVIDAMHNLFLGLVQEHFDILGIKLNNTKSTMTPSIIINIPEESINKLNKHERKSISNLINMLGAPMAKELKSQASYNLYFKWLSALHKAALKLLCTFVSAPLKLNKSKLNKPYFIHAILAWVRYFLILINTLCLSGPCSNWPKPKIPRILAVGPFSLLRRWPSFTLTSKTWLLLPGSRQFWQTSVNQAMESSRQINGICLVLFTFLFRLFGYGTSWRMAMLSAPNNARSYWK